MMLQEILKSNLQIKTNMEGADDYLKSSSGEIINYNYSAAFWADNNADSYEEYVFDIAYEELAGCEVMGEF